MNPTLIRTTLRERFSAINRWVSVILLFALPIFYAYAMPQMKGASVTGIWGALLVWMLGAGIIGEDISNGTILLVLARPIRRWEYVMSKWAALSILTVSILVAQALATTAVLIRTQQTVLPAEVLLRVVESILLGTGSAAVVVMFSVLVAGGKEVSSIMLCWAAGWGMTALGTWQHLPWLSTLGGSVVNILYPAVALGGMSLIGAGMVVLRWSAAISLLLLGAVAVINRKEFSYSAG
jgi:hypothetical protein